MTYFSDVVDTVETKEIVKESPIERENREIAEISDLFGSSVVITSDSTNKKKKFNLFDSDDEDDDILVNDPELSAFVTPKIKQDDLLDLDEVKIDNARETITAEGYDPLTIVSKPIISLKEAIIEDAPKVTVKSGQKVAFKVLKERLKPEISTFLSETIAEVKSKTIVPNGKRRVTDRQKASATVNVLREFSSQVQDDIVKMAIEDKIDNLQRQAKTNDAKKREKLQQSKDKRSLKIQDARKRKNEDEGFDFFARVTERVQKIQKESENAKRRKEASAFRQAKKAHKDELRTAKKERRDARRAIAKMESEVKLKLLMFL